MIRYGTKQRVALKPYKDRPLKPIVYMTAEEFGASNNRTFVVDTETYPNYFLAAFKCVETKKVITFEISPDTTLNPQLLSHVMHAHTTIGFNSLAYDLPIIWFAHICQDIKRIKQLSNSLISGERTEEVQKEYGFKIYQTPHIDLIGVCPLRGSLKTYGARLHSERLQDLPFFPHGDLTYEEAQIVKHYCINNDLDATMLIAVNLAEQLRLRDDLSVQYKTNLLSKSDPQVAEGVISAELHRLMGKRPQRPNSVSVPICHYNVPEFICFQTPLMQNALKVVREAEYEVLESGTVIIPKSVSDLKLTIGRALYKMGNGGLHSSEKNVGYKADENNLIKDIDVTSYYPRIIINQKLFPKHLGPAFLSVYESLYDTRLAAKKAKDYARSEGLKIAINGIFGKTGNPYSIVYSPDLLVQITVTGQLGLLMQIEMYELNGITVISANTDGVVLHCPRDKLDLLNQIVKMWERQTGFETEETEYSAYYARDVNNYLAFKKNGEVKGKGVYANPWADPKQAIYRFHQNPKVTVCTKAVVNLIDRGIPIEQTIRGCTDVREFVAVRNVPGLGAHQNNEYLGKVVRWYYATGPSRAIYKVENGNLVSESEGAKPLMDLPAALPDDIDYQWYINRTERMLEDLAFRQRTKLLF